MLEYRGSGGKTLYPLPSQKTMRLTELGKITVETGPQAGVWIFFMFNMKKKPNSKETTQVKAAVRIRTPQQSTFNMKGKDGFNWGQVEEIAKKRVASGKVVDYDLVVVIDGQEIKQPDASILKMWYQTRVVNAARKALKALPGAK